MVAREVKMRYICWFGRGGGGREGEGAYKWGFRTKIISNSFLIVMKLFSEDFTYFFLGLFKIFDCLLFM